MTGKLTLDEALAFSEPDREERYPELTGLQKSAIAATAPCRSKFSVETALTLNKYQVEALDSFDVQLQLEQGLLTAEQFLEKSETELSELCGEIESSSDEET